MSEEEKNKDTPPEEPPEETGEPGQKLDDAIHALAPEDPDSDSTEESPEQNPEETALTTREKNTPGPRRGRGFFDVLVVLVLAGLGVGEYLFVERQKAQQRFLNDRFSKIEQSIQALENRKPSSPSAPPAEIQSALDNLSSQIQELKGQVNTTQNQQQETVNWVKGELEKVQSAPPNEQEEPEEPEEEPQEVEDPEPEHQETEAHGSDDFNPEESFIDFVENLGSIVIGGIKDGVVFVWDKLNDLIDPPADTPSATPASNK